MFYTHLDVISKHMARSVVAEMAFVKNSINKPEYKTVLKTCQKAQELILKLKKEDD